MSKTMRWPPPSLRAENARLPIAGYSPPEMVNPSRDELFRVGSSFKPTRREEIVGIDNILIEVEEMIHWLCNAQQYGRHSARLQPGAVFSGNPGMGKSLTARWIASASEALFINIRDFAHESALYTDTDIQDLFLRARAAYAADRRPVLLFWDEFENAAIERMDGSTTPEQRSVVSQLTAELDGIHGKNEGVLLIGCTNYLHNIDAALLRRGRMGVQVQFTAPNRHGKELILRHYLGQYKITPDIDYHTLSFFFDKDDTAADIEEACVEAWRGAVRRSLDSGDEPVLSQQDLITVFLKQLLGPPMAFSLPDAEKLPIAVHEAGHAIAALVLGVPLRLITVQPGSNSLGRVLFDDPTEYISSTRDLMNRLITGFGGIAAERVAGIGPMTGSRNDIAQINRGADALVNNYYASEKVGFFDITALDRETDFNLISPQISPASIDLVDQEVRLLIAQVWARTSEMMLAVGADALGRIARELIERVTMTGVEFREALVRVLGFEPEMLNVRTIDPH